MIGGNPYSPRRNGSDPVSVGDPYLTRPWNQYSNISPWNQNFMVKPHKSTIRSSICETLNSKNIDKEDDCNIRDDIVGEIHSPEENYKDQDVWTEDPKKKPDSFEKEVLEEDIQDAIIRSLDQKVVDSVNQFPKLKEDNRELSKIEIITFGSFEVEIDSVFCNEQMTCSDVKELVAVVKTNDVPIERFHEENKKLLDGVVEKVKFIISSLVLSPLSEEPTNVLGLDLGRSDYGKEGPKDIVPLPLVPENVKESMALVTVGIKQDQILGPVLPEREQL